MADVTSLVDVGPTLLDLVGAEPLPFATGRSLAGQLREHGEEARVASNPCHPSVAFSEYCGLLGDRPAIMVRKGPLKLNHYHGYEIPQLFNLQDDPGEVRDRANDPACAGVRGELMRIVRENWRGGIVEKATQQRQAEAAFLVKWRASIPRGMGTQHVVQDRWKAPPDCNVFPET